MQVYLVGFSKRLSTVTSPVSPVPPPPLPLPNFPVPSSYKNGNCLSISTSLDILDNIHPRKYPLASVVFYQGRKPELKLACFLRARQKLTGRRLSKSRYGTNVRARFARREKSLVNNFGIKKRDLSICYLLKESASMLEQTSSSYGELKLGLVGTK